MSDDDFDITPPKAFNARSTPSGGGGGGGGSGSKRKDITPSAAIPQSKSVRVVLVPNFFQGPKG